jgi:murein L,D-transpeptidase YafK
MPYSERSRDAISRTKAILETELEATSLQLGSPIFIRILKESKELEVWIENEDRFELFRTYDICVFSGTLGPKIVQGDGQSPEGFYFVSTGRLHPCSTFHLSFNLGYPNAYDRFHRRTGSALMVHGNCVSIGCYAMTNEGIEEIYTLADAALRNGQPFFRVHIFPFHMTDSKLELHSDSQWYDFWQNLKEGYEYFVQEGSPPDVIVRNGRYAFQQP